MPARLRSGMFLIPFSIEESDQHFWFSPLKFASNMNQASKLYLLLFLGLLQEFENGMEPCSLIIHKLNYSE